MEVILGQVMRRLDPANQPRSADSAWYDSGMTAKIAISLPDEYVSAARRAVEQGRAPSVSAYIADAMAMRERTDSLRDLLDELDHELGPPTQEELDWADEILGTA